MRLLTAARLREVERGESEAVLIQRASTAVARRAAQMTEGTYGRRVLVVAGPGHNGADALWAAVRLAERGAAIDVSLPLGEPRDEHGAEPLRRLLRAPRARGTYDLTIDGVLGIGARGWDSPPPWAAMDGLVLAVDVPSGIDADTGAVSPGAVRADVTVTFIAAKPGLLLAPAHAGLVEVAALGLSVGDGDDARVMSAEDVAALLALPDGETDKYRRGVVGVVAGSERYPGAAALAVRGAQRTGCGYVRLLAPRSVADVVRAAYPEVVAAERGGDLPKADAWVVGPGLGDDKDAVRAVLATGAPVVVDADAIALAPRDLLHERVVLTPHTGEFERLTGVTRAEAERDRLGHAARAAADLGCTVLLKGTATVVASPDGARWVNPTGTPLLATAGTGDVLSGIVAALLSGGAPPGEAAAAAAWLHGMAARVAVAPGAPGLTALDVAEGLPEAARIALAPC